MEIFIDTSALFALINEADYDHEAAQDLWDHLTDTDDMLICNNYIIVECLALLQNRLGMEAVQLLQNIILPCFRVQWIGEEEHTSIVHDLLSANRRNLSLVDCASFETMRRLGINTVFAFDEHFCEQGFKVIP